MSRFPLLLAGPFSRGGAFSLAGAFLLAGCVFTTRSIEVEVIHDTEQAAPAGHPIHWSARLPGSGPHSKGRFSARSSRGI